MKTTGIILFLMILSAISGCFSVSALEGCHTLKIMGKNCCAPGLNWGESDGIFWCEGDEGYAENCKSCIGSGSNTTSEKKVVEEKPPCDESQNDDSEARFADISGQVEIAPDCDLTKFSWKFAKTNTIIHINDHIKTAEDSSAIIYFSDGSIFILKPESEVIITIPSYPKSKIGLVFGNIWMNMKKMIKDGSMDVDMNQAVTSIKGTTLICEETGSQSTIKVIGGEVIFTSKATGEKKSIGSKETAFATSSGISDVTSFDVNTELDQWRNLGVDTSEIIADDGSITTDVNPHALNSFTNPGSIWKVKEYGPMGDWDGNWVVRKDGKTIDASWSGGMITDIIEIQSTKGDQINLYRHGNMGYYTGTISPDGMSISGKGSWYSPGQTWLITLSPGNTDENLPKSSLKEHIQNGIIYQWANWNKNFVQNGPPLSSTTFSISQPVILSYIDTYHWNDGKSLAKSGTISLISNDGTKYGPWGTGGSPGQDNNKNAWWRAYPYVKLPAGTYSVIDSDPETWSNNAGSNNAGFAGIQCQLI